MTTRTQSHRDVAINTPLGEDVLLLSTMQGDEQLGRLFTYELTLLSEKHDISFEQIIGQNITIRLQQPDEQARYFNGFVSRFVQKPARGELARYEAEVVPWLWFLTRTADCRIFQDMSTPEIVKQIFREHGFTDFDDALNESYSACAYCVQYRETDFNFISRLLEREGIYYFFEHDNGKHTLVLADGPGSHAPNPGYESVPYAMRDADRDDPDWITGWRLRQQLQPGGVALGDFDFEQPKKSLQVSPVSISRDHATADMEVYDYPGEYDDLDQGEVYARRRIEELHTEFEQARARSYCRGLLSGATFTLIDHPRNDQNREYLITAISHEIECDAFGSGDGAGSIYRCQFAAIDAQQPFRPRRSTAEPVIQGPQTAIVVGKEGEEIWTDKYGRVKVQFHWDRYGKADENSSCWIRVAQVWAGKKWGAMHIPRIGQEVIVEFLEGDPDRPIITGRVYNGEAMPPYDLAENATVSGIKSRSSKDAEQENFNEIRFEDKKGEEQIFIHAERNFDLRVENDRYETVENDRHLSVENDKFEHVQNDRHEQVDRHHHEQVGEDRHLKVEGKEAKEVAQELSLVVGQDVAEEFGGDHSMVVTGDTYIDATNICLEASTNITLKVGQSYIAIDGNGIEIGTMGDINITCKGSATLEGAMEANVESDLNTQVKGAFTKVNADAILEVKGSLVKIN